MKNFEELTEKELLQVDGGFVDRAVYILAGLLIAEWETTKRAAIDLV